MPKIIDGDAETVLAKVQVLFDEIAPGARCELKDYQYRIGCGDMDRQGNIQDVRFLRRGLTEEDVRHRVEMLATKVRTGGSTVG